MPTFEMQASLTTSRLVEVTAKSELHAKDLVRRQYEKGDITLHCLDTQFFFVELYVKGNKNNTAEQGNSDNDTIKTPEIDLQAPDQTFRVLLSETVTKDVSVDANNRSEAVKELHRQWNENELDMDDYCYLETDYTIEHPVTLS